MAKPADPLLQLLWFRWFYRVVAKPEELAALANASTFDDGRTLEWYKQWYNQHYTWEGIAVGYTTPTVSQQPK